MSCRALSGAIPVTASTNDLSAFKKWGCDIKIGAPIPVCNWAHFVTFKTPDFEQTPSGQKPILSGFCAGAAKISVGRV